MKSVPQQKSANSSDMSEGSLVQYDDNSLVYTAVVLSLKGDKLHVLNYRGREADLQKLRLHELPGRIPASCSTTAQKAAYLEKIVADAEASATEINVSDLWDVASLESREYTSDELTTLYFNTNELASHMAMRAALVKDRTFFKREKKGFSPRPSHIVDDLKKAEGARHRKLELEEEFIHFCTERIKNPALAIPSHIKSSIELLEEVAASVEQSDQARNRESKDLILLAVSRLGLGEGGSNEEKAFRLLELIGHFDQNTNLSIIRHGVGVAFSSELLEASRNFESQDPYLPNSDPLRQDFSDRECITIDDITTRDMDDAISLRDTELGIEVGIHITDIATRIQPGSLFDLEAERRGTSIYNAEGVVNMLPPELSEEALSLRAGLKRPCLSVICNFSHSFKLESFTVTPSLIEVTRRLTYDDVDNLLEHSDRFLGLLYEVSAQCEQKRISQGAQRVHKREAVPFLEEDNSIRLLEIDESSPARMLVSELMVLANSCFATFAAEKNIPMLFRGQERPDENIGAHHADSDAAPEGPARDFQTRVRLKKSITSLSPVAHAGLGLPCYIQATSPIRRYMDLVHQRQLLWFAKSGTPWLQATELEQLVRKLEGVLAAAQSVSRESRRFWLLRYLELRDKRSSIRGTVVRTESKNPIVELDEVFITVPFRAYRPVRIGDELELKIVSVDARGDYLRVESV